MTTQALPLMYVVITKGINMCRTIGEILKDARKGHGMTMKGLACRADILPPSYSRIENDRVYPRMKTLKAICAVLELDPISVVIEGGDA